MISKETLAQANAELALAETARSTGFEGRARVSARRAAGVVIRAFLSDRGMSVGTVSAYDLLQILRDLSEIDDAARQLVSHLLMRVSEDFTISGQVDLVAESRQLIGILEKLDT